MPNIHLDVNNKRFAGWKTARVVRGIECIAGGFELDVSDRWGSAPDEAWQILEEDECELFIDDQLVISGYVDQRSIFYNANEHTLSLSGRDKTGTLVDCSPALTKWDFANISALTLAKRIAEPFGIAVSLQAGLAAPRNAAKLTADPGDSAFEIIERACRIAGLLPVADGSGGLVLTRAGSSKATTALVEGENILAASITYEANARARRYVVLGQHQGTDDFVGTGPAGVKGEATDLNVLRSERVIVIRAEGNVTKEQAKSRAQWEAKARAARAAQAQVTVQGWTQGDGSLWPVNARVAIRSPLLGIDGEMLITQVEYAVDDSAGTTTQLSLKRPDAYLPEAVIPKDSTDHTWREIRNGGR